MTVTFPLSYCGIEPLPKKFGFNAEHSTSTDRILTPGQTIMTEDIYSSGSENGPSFGNLQGNFQPSHDTSDAEVLATGGKVDNPKVAVDTINNKDGTGSGHDEYKLYLGDGSSFPKKDQWVSFEDM